MTETDVANLALAILDEAPIAAITDDNKAARLCNRWFAQTRKAELARHAWYFAIETDPAVVGVDTGTGAGTLAWEYDLPAAALRLLPVTYDNQLAGVPISWELRDGKLYSDQETPRGLRYIKDVTDPTDWPPLFVEVMAAALALKMAHALTHKASMIQIAQNAYERALEDALRVNALERDARLYDAGWSVQRADYRYWRP